jgi:hypothetical protein
MTPSNLEVPAHASPVLLLCALDIHPPTTRCFITTQQRKREHQHICICIDTSNVIGETYPAGAVTVTDTTRVSTTVCATETPSKRKLCSVFTLSAGALVRNAAARVD